MAKTAGRSWVLYVVIGMLVVIAALFVIAMAETSTRSATGETVSADSYRERVDVLLANADPERGAQLVVTQGCTACHREGAVNGIAPPFQGIAERAAEMRPPMPADAYIYESIAFPSAFLVEGFANAMVQNYEDTVSDQDLGDIIAYLLTPDAN